MNFFIFFSRIRNFVAYHLSVHTYLLALQRHSGSFPESPKIPNLLVVSALITVVIQQPVVVSKLRLVSG